MNFKVNKHFFVVLKLMFTIKLLNGNVLNVKFSTNTELVEQLKESFGQNCTSFEDCQEGKELYYLKKKCQCLPNQRWNYEKSKCVDLDYCKNDFDCKDFDHKKCNSTLGKV